MGRSAQRITSFSPQDHVASTGVGPKGGKYYITKGGTKVYGEPPPALMRQYQKDSTTRIQSFSPAVTKTISREKPSAPTLSAKTDSARIQHVGGSKNDIANVEHLVKAAGYGPLLKNHPLRVTYQPGSSVSGLYSAQKGLILGQYKEPTGAVKAGNATPFLKTGQAAAAPGSVGPRMPHGVETGSNPKFYLNGNSSPKLDRYNSVIVHEISHHLQDKGLAKYPELNAKIEAAHAEARRTGSAVSHYALTSKHEWFAETHTAYVFRGSELKEARPSDWSLIRESRLAAGMEE